MKLNLPWSIFNAEIFLRNGEGKESRVQRFPPFFGNRTFCRPLFPLFSLSEPISSAPPFLPCNSLFARLTAIISSFWSGLNFFFFLSLQEEKIGFYVASGSRSLSNSQVFSSRSGGSFFFSVVFYFLPLFFFYSSFLDFFFRSCFYAARATCVWRVSLSLNKKIREFVFFSEFFLANFLNYTTLTTELLFTRDISRSLSQIVISFYYIQSFWTAFLDSSYPPFIINQIVGTALLKIGGKYERSISAKFEARAKSKYSLSHILSSSRQQ